MDKKEEDDVEPLIDNDDKDKPVEADEEQKPAAVPKEKPEVKPEVMSEQESESSFGTDSDQSFFSKDSSGKTKEWDDDKFVWRKHELEWINQSREKKDKIPRTYRRFYIQWGHRAHPEMTFWRSLWSMIVPWQNEFVSIWLYIAFATYFWVELCLIMAKGKEYEFNNEMDYWLMFIATFAIASSLTMTAVYLIFYSMGETYYKTLELFNYMGYLFVAYALVFVVIASELKATDNFFGVLFVLGVTFMAVMVMTQYELGRKIGFWISVGVLSTVVFFDLVLNASKKQTRVFYVPEIIEGLCLTAGILVLYYEIPDRFCKNSKVVQLYVSSYIIFTLIFINFLFETHGILYYTLKLNSNYLDDDDEWWKVKNIYNTS